jgi:flagellar biogenesis protein FliO
MEGIRQFAAIGLTFGLLAALLWWLRRAGVVRLVGRRRTTAIEVLESRTLCPGHNLHLVRVADRVLALATHSSGCTLLESGLSTQPSSQRSESAS